MKFLKITLKIIIGIIALFYLMLAIGGMINSWKAGLLLLIGALLLILFVLTSFKILLPKISRGMQIGICITSFILFIAGFTMMPSTPKKDINSENKNPEPSILVSEKVVTIDTAIIRSFQKKWVDSIVKDWNGSYVNGGELSSNLDTIYFKLTKTATKGKWKETAEIHESIHQKMYDSLLSVSITEQNSRIKTTIVFLPNQEQEEENLKMQKRKEEVSKQFSNWDGSHSNLKNLIKQNMHDPKSFKHVETTYKDKGEYIFVRMTYRGKNPLGATVLNTVEAKVDFNGNVLSILN